MKFRTFFDFRSEKYRGKYCFKIQSLSDSGMNTNNIMPMFLLLLKGEK